MKDLDLKSAKGVRTPGTAKDLVDVEEGSEPLDEHRREKSVSSVQRALILSLDRRDVVCAVRGWRRRVKDADEEQWCELNRLSRYPNSHTKRRNLHASTWRPVLTAEGSCARSLLAGHGEVYGAGPAVSEAPGLVNPRLDSTAAIGTVKRWGSGKMNDIQHLHLQALIRDGRIASIDKVNIEVTESDGERLRTLMKMLGKTLRQEEATGLIQVSNQQIFKLLAAVLRHRDSWNGTVSIQSESLFHASDSMSVLVEMTGAEKFSNGDPTSILSSDS